MHLIAHRGWIAGEGENSLEAFARADADPAISGVEFDVSRAPDSTALLVSHDPPLTAAGALRFDEALTFLAGTDLHLYIELKQEGLAPAVIDRLVAHGLADRAVVFAFAKVARSFPWHEPRPVKLGVIVEYPWDLNRWARQQKPDVLLLGWDDRTWTRVAFRSWWSCFSLERVGRRHGVPVVVGVVQRQRDLDWLKRQGIAAAVGDIDLIRGTQR
jgi:glycerophosphoryl diester phosphodiesterase